MPSGKTHIRINWIVLALINVLILAFNHDISIKHYFLFNICFILTSYYISPDLDINSSVYKRWAILKWVWWPYREIMKHRQTSHSIIWGPVSMLLYISLLIIPGILVINKLFPIACFVGCSSEIVVISGICIVCICEIHIFADKIL
jgi:uncharacterized metal-binding protein